MRNTVNRAGESEFREDDISSGILIVQKENVIVKTGFKPFSVLRWQLSLVAASARK